MGGAVGGVVDILPAALPVVARVAGVALAGTPMGWAVGAAAFSNVVNDWASGDIKDWGDAAKAAGTGAGSALGFGLLGGPVGKAAGKAIGTRVAENLGPGTEKAVSKFVGGGLVGQALGALARVPAEMLGRSAIGKSVAAKGGAKVGAATGQALGSGAGSGLANLFRGRGTEPNSGSNPPGDSNPNPNPAGGQQPGRYVGGYVESNDGPFTDKGPPGNGFLFQPNGLSPQLTSWYA